jgi:hypothetical protein
MAKMLTFQQFLQKHNPHIKHHDRLFYGKYTFSQRIFMPISENGYRLQYTNFSDSAIDVALSSWYRTNVEIAQLRTTIKELQHDIKLRREGRILHLYANDIELLDQYITSVKGIFDDNVRLAELSCSPAISEKNVRVRQKLPHGRFRSEVVLRTWNWGTKPTAEDKAVRKFYETYKGQVWNRALEKDGGACGWSYTSLWLEDSALVPVCYLVFGEAVQKVLTYKLESEMDT